MKRLVLSLSLLILLSGSTFAQNPIRKPAGDDFGGITPTPTPEMWFYAQEMKSYNDPKQMVRRNAQLRADQRRARIAAAQWLGTSRLRPPTLSRNYGAVMLAPNAWDPMLWGRTFYGPSAEVTPDENVLRR